MFLMYLCVSLSKGDYTDAIDTAGMKSSPYVCAIYVLSNCFCTLMSESIYSLSLCMCNLHLFLFRVVC